LIRVTHVPRTACLKKNDPCSDTVLEQKMRLHTSCLLKQETAMAKKGWALDHQQEKKKK